jgi:hypothetical protein
MKYLFVLHETPYWSERTYTGLRWDDQTRIGLYLTEISRPLAGYYGLDSARGVVVRQIGALMMWIDLPAIEGAHEFGPGVMGPRPGRMVLRKRGLCEARKSCQDEPSGKRKIG